MIDVSRRLAMGSFVDVKVPGMVSQIAKPSQHKVEPLPLSHCRELEPGL